MPERPRRAAMPPLYRPAGHLRARRQALGLSQVALGAAAIPPMSGSEISKIENGYRALTQEWRHRLAPALSCEPEDLLPSSDPVAALGARIEALWERLDTAQRAALLARLGGPKEGRALVLREPEPATEGEAAEADKPSAAAAELAAKLVEIVVEDDGRYTATVYYRPRRGRRKNGV